MHKNYNGFNIYYLVDKNNKFVDIYDAIHNIFDDINIKMDTNVKHNFNVRYCISNNDQISQSDLSNCIKFKNSFFDSSINVDNKKVHMCLYYKDSYIDEIIINNNSLKNTHKITFGPIQENDLPDNSNVWTIEINNYNISSGNTLPYNFKYKLEYVITKLNGNIVDSCTEKINITDGEISWKYQIKLPEANTFYIFRYRLKLYTDDGKYLNYSEYKTLVKYYAESDENKWYSTEEINSMMQFKNKLSGDIDIINNLKQIRYYAKTVSNSNDSKYLYWYSVDEDDENNVTFKLLKGIYEEI